MDVGWLHDEQSLPKDGVCSVALRMSRMSVAWVIWMVGFWLSVLLLYVT